MNGLEDINQYIMSAVPHRIRRPIRAPLSEKKQEQEPQEQEEKQEQEPQIIISFFRADTRKEFLASTQRFLGHYEKTKKNKGDWVLLYDLDEKEIFGLGVLRAIDGDRVWREAHPYDTGIYSEENVKYNKYEIGVKIIQITPISKISLMEAIGLPPSTPLWDVKPTSFKKIHAGVISPIRPWIHRTIAETWRSLVI
jgi:hypothetical protein